MVSNKTLFFSTCLAIAALPILGLADEVPYTEKVIRIEADNDAGENSLRVNFRSSSRSYKVKEKIRFQVKGNKDFYLYLFNIDPRTGKGIAILPNRYQPGKEIKFEGDGQWHTVPNTGVSFYSDRPGVERITMVASERYLDAGRLMKSSKSKSIGDFYEMEDPLEGLKQVISEEYTEELSTEKLIHVGLAGEDSTSSEVRPSLTISGPAPRGLVTQEIDLRIR